MRAFVLANAVLFVRVQSYDAVVDPPSPDPLPDKWPFNRGSYDLYNYPKTDVSNSGFMDCTQPELCMGADRNYFIQAVVRKYTIKGSHRIAKTKYQNNNILNGELKRFWDEKSISNVDVTFYTRTFEYLPVNGTAKNSRFCAAGGDGTASTLGPCLETRPGETLNMFIMNNIRKGPILLNQPVPTKKGYQAKMHNVNLNQNNIFMRDLFAFGTPEGRLTPGVWFAKNLAVPNEENVPGWRTNHSWDYFNVHLHGVEVLPHLYVEVGTSDPLSDWITIQPYDTYGQQCHCYRFRIASTQSKGVFIYHTHRHGTTSMTTWGGMFGLLMTDALLPSEIHKRQKQPVTAGNNQSSSLMHNLIKIARKEKLQFEDTDVVPFVIWNSKWKFMGDWGLFAPSVNAPMKQQMDHANIFNQGRVELNYFLPNQIPTTVMDPFLVNDGYQPTFAVTAGHLTLIRLVCVSTEWMCGFQIYNESDYSIQGFDVVASDGITWHAPVHMDDKGYAVENNRMMILQPSQAFLLLGGGQRQDLLVQFPRAGNLTVYQTTFGGQSPQTLAWFNIKAGKRCGRTTDCVAKNLTKYQMTAATAFVPEERPIELYRAMTMAQQLNRSMIPWVQWGLSDYNQSAHWFQMYDVRHVNMLLRGGSCEVWEICSRNPINHPYHIHVNPFMIMNISIAFPDVLACKVGAKMLSSRLAEPIFRFNKPYEWRDTAWVPPCGCLTTKQCYDAGAPRIDEGPSVGFEGKFVFHCHFLTHEDTGLIHNVMLRRTQKSKRPSVWNMYTTIFPGQVLPADTSACSWRDPCGVVTPCSLCRYAFMHNSGCTCEVPAKNFMFATSITSADNLRRQFLAEAARPAATHLVLAATVGGAAAAILLAAISRFGHQMRAPLTEEQSDEATVE